MKQLEIISRTLVTLGFLALAGFLFINGAPGWGWPAGAATIIALYERKTK